MCRSPANIFPILCAALWAAYCSADQFGREYDKQMLVLRSNQSGSIHVQQSSHSQLLKAKADSVLRVVPEVERLLFRQCSVSAEDEPQLARCFVALFRARDRRAEAKGDGENAGPAQAGESMVGRLVRTVLGTLFPFLADPKGKGPEMENIGGNETEAFLSADIRWRAVGNVTSGSSVRVPQGVKRRTLKRAKRKSASSGQNCSLSNLEKLERIRNFYESFKRYTESIDRYNALRKKILRDFPQLIAPKADQDQPDEVGSSDGAEGVRQNENENNTYVLSPRLLSLFPAERAKIDHKRREALKQNDGNSSFHGDREQNGQREPSVHRFLSPDILSFHDDETDRKSGRLTIPRLIKRITSDRRQHNQLLDFFIQITGAAPVLERLHSQIAHMAAVLDQKVFPLATNLLSAASGLAQLSDTMTRKQREYFDQMGYTFLGPAQMELAKPGEGRRRGLLSRRQKREAAIDDAAFGHVARLMEADIEGYIERVARLPTGGDVHSLGGSELALDGIGHSDGIARMRRKGVPNSELRKLMRLSRRRRKRQLPISGPIYGVLTPFAFVPQVNSLQLFTLYVLSPQAFIPSYQNPAFFYVQLLTPWAFLANYASPQGFTCLCISPVFFEANLLSPQMFYLELLSPTIMQANLLSPYFFLATILSPQIMIADLLTPNFFQYKIFSPQIGLAALLSPNIGSPNIFSDEQSVVNVLSPPIASPNIYSKISNGLFILSPEIFGGHDDENNFETEGENVVTVPDTAHPEAAAGHTHGEGIRSPLFDTNGIIGEKRRWMRNTERNA